MSQAGILNINDGDLPGDVATSFVTDSGTAVPFDHVIEIVGAGGAITSAIGNVITITAAGSAAVDRLLTDISGPVVPITGDISVTGATNIFSDGSVANTLRLNLQGPNHSLFVGRGSDVASASLSVGTNGQLLIAATGADPAFSSLTSTGSTISFTPGVNSLNLEAGASVPTTFTANSGSATPALNNINILGSSPVAGTSPVSSVASGSTLTLNVQKSQALSATDATKVGLSNFDSASFTVDANGFVSLVGGSGAVIEKVNVQTGTSPIVPSSGAITINGSTVVAGTNPVRSDGTGANTLAIEVQTSQAIAASDATKIGLSNFNSAHFTVDANGFVDLIGGGIAIDSIGVDAATAPGTNPVAPTAAGLITVTGAQVASGVVGANVIRTDSLSANAYSIEIQRSTTNATTDSTKNGVSHFDSADFTVDANGFVSATTTGFIKTLTGNSGGAIAPVANNINTVGTGSITSIGTAGTITTQLTGLTNHSVQVGAGTATLTQLSVGTNGQVLVGATGADPAFATLTSSDSSISFTAGVNTLSLQVAGGTSVGKTITGNTGGALSPTAGNWNILGTGSITTSGSGSTLTTQLTGLTNHAVLVGAGTATITSVGPTATIGQVLQSAGSSADPAFSTATYPLTTTINQILYSSSANTVTGLATANNSVFTTGTTGIPVATPLSSNGQVIIGSGSGAPAASTLTAGTGITITNAANSITIASVGGGFTWNDVTTTSASMAVNNGYLSDNAGLVTLTLPATAVQFSVIRVAGNGAGGWKIAQNANQLIQFGSAAATTTGITGSLSSTNRYDTVELIAVVGGASTQWNVLSSVGNQTIV